MKIARVGVVGAGTMGQGIAEMLAKKGLEVFLLDQNPELLETAIKNIETSLMKQIDKWAITNAEKKLILAKIHNVDELQDLVMCELVIETITEDLAAKKEVFRSLDGICREDVILASNTSTLSLTELASECLSPGRVIGLHFIPPVSKIDLVEIVRGLKTTNETFQAMREFVENTISKKGIQVYESPGFVTTRLICTLINEALQTLSEGVANAEEIDAAMKIGYEFRYGPLEMCDRFGLDAVYAALHRLFREFGDQRYRPSFLLKKMVRAGRLGVKTGQGFFRYDEEGDRI